MQIVADKIPKGIKQILSRLFLLGCVAVAPAWLGAGCAGDRYHRSAREYVDDRSNAAEIKSALLGDKVVSGVEVKVQAYEGIVQLSGFVDSQAQRDRAGEIARGIHGVRTVRNDLIVKEGLIVKAP
jgi:hyperosmotically inducible protein